MTLWLPFQARMVTILDARIITSWLGFGTIGCMWIYCGWRRQYSQSLLINFLRFVNIPLQKARRPSCTPAKPLIKFLSQKLWPDLCRPSKMATCNFLLALAAVAMAAWAIPVPIYLTSIIHRVDCIIKIIFSSILGQKKSYSRNRGQCLRIHPRELFPKHRKLPTDPFAHLRKQLNQDFSLEQHSHKKHMRAPSHRLPQDKGLLIEEAAGERRRSGGKYQRTKEDYDRFSKDEVSYCKDFTSSLSNSNMVE